MMLRRQEKLKRSEVKKTKSADKKTKIFVQEENSFFCTLCDKQYLSKKLFDLHKYFHKIEAKESQQKIDSSKNVFVCNFCEAQCLTAEKLASHIESHKENCKECETTFANAFTLGIHMAEHDKDEKICCPFCDYRGTLSHCLKTHLLTRHFKLKIFRCESCGANYSSKVHLEEHIRFHHDKMEPHTCIVCQRKFIFKSSLKKHQINTHRPLIDGDIPSNYCILCKRTLNTVEALKKHIEEKHTKQKPKNTEKFICDICGKDFSHRQSWLLHTKGHTGLKPYKCKLCSKAFKVQAFLTVHEKIHSDEKPFSCEVCGAGFKRKEGLRRHLLTHTDIKPFVCPNCAKAFRRREHLRLHLKCCNKKHEYLLGMQKQSSQDQPPKNTSTTPRIPEGPICSFCYFCGKEFNMFESNSHQCLPMNLYLLENQGIDKTVVQNTEKILTSVDMNKVDENIRPQNTAVAETASVTSAQIVTQNRDHLKKKGRNQEMSKTLDEQSISIVEVKIEQNDSSDANKSSVVEFVLARKKTNHFKNKNKQSLQSSQQYNNSLNNLARCSRSPIASTSSVQNVDSVQNESSKRILERISCNQPPQRSQNVESVNLGQNISNQTNYADNVSLSEAQTNLSSDDNVVQSSFQKTTRPKASFCEFCGLETSNPDDLKSHHQTVHDQDSFLCFICKDIFNDTCELMLHYKTKHRESDARKAELDSFSVTTEGATSKFRYYCSQCGLGSDRIYALLNHKKKSIKLGHHSLEEGLKIIGVGVENKSKKISLLESKKREKIICDKKQAKRTKFNLNNFVKNKEINNQTPKPLNRMFIKEKISMSVNKIAKNDTESFRNKNASKKKHVKPVNHNSTQTRKNTKQGKDGSSSGGIYKNNEVFVAETQIDPQKLFDHKKIVESKQEMVNEIKTIATGSLHQDESTLVMNFIDDSDHFDEETEQEIEKDQENSDRKSSDIILLDQKDIKIKPLYIWVKKEELECVKYKAIDKKRNRDTFEKGSRPGKHRDSIKRKEALLKIRRQNDKKRQSSINSDSLEDRSSKASQSKTSDKTKNRHVANKTDNKGLRKIKEPPKIAKQVIKECDIFNIKTNAMAPVKKGFKQFVTERSSVEVVEKSKIQKVKKIVSFDQYKQLRNRNDNESSNESKKTTELSKPTSAPLAESSKSNQWLYSTDTIGNIIKSKVHPELNVLPNKPMGSHNIPVIISQPPQYSEQAMQIITEFTQTFEMYNMIPGDFDNAKFSDDSNSEIDTYQEMLPTVFCEVCGCHCRSTAHLKEHMALLHAGFRFVCFVCDHRFSSLDAVISHQKKYPKNVLSTAESRFLRLRKSMPNMLYPYYCNQCGKGFTLIEIIAIHKKCKHKVQGDNKKKYLNTKNPINADDALHSTKTSTSVQNQQVSIGQNDPEININQTSILTTLDLTTGNAESQESNNKNNDNRKDILTTNVERNFLNVNSNPSTDDKEKIVDQCQDANQLQTLSDQETKSDQNITPLTDSSANTVNTAPDSYFSRFCELCGQKHASFADQERDLHLETFKCIICKNPYETIDLLVTHYDRRHPKYEVANFEFAQIPADKNPCYYCKFCGKGFHFIGELLEHRECEHFDLTQKEKEDLLITTSSEKCSKMTKNYRKEIVEDTESINDKSKIENIDGTNTNLIQPTLDKQTVSFSGISCRDITNSNENKPICESDALPDKKLDINVQSLPKPNIVYNQENTDPKCNETKNKDMIDLLELSDVSDITTHNSDLEKNRPKKNDLVEEIGNLSDISDTHLNSSSLIIDLETLSSSESSEENGLSNFADIPKPNIVHSQENTDPKCNETKNKDMIDLLELSDVSDITTHNSDLEKNRPKKNDLVEENGNLSDISDTDLNSSSLIIDLETLGSSESSEENGLSNFVDVEEFIKEKQMHALKGNPENDIEKSNQCDPVASSNILSNLESEDWDEVAKQLADEVALMAEENLLENCHEEVTEILTISEIPLEKGDDNRNITYIFCEVCGQKYQNKQDLDLHFTNNHNKKSFRCSVCDEMFTNISSLVEHQDLKHQSATLEYAEKYSLKLLFSKEIPEHFRYYCNICGKGFNDIYFIKIHKESSCPMKIDSSSVQDCNSQTNKSANTNSFDEIIKHAEITSEPNILCGNDLKIPRPSENPSEMPCEIPSAYSSKNETLISTTQNPEDTNNFKAKCTDIIYESPATPKKTMSKPVCNKCGKEYAYWHLLIEHRALCAGSHTPDNEPVKEQTVISGSKDSDCYIVENSDNKPTTNTATSTISKNDLKKNEPLAKTHFCNICHEGFVRRYELTEHRLKACEKYKPTFKHVQLVSTPQIAPDSSKNQPISFEAETFRCPVCPNRVFLLKESLDQHSIFSKNHIWLDKVQKKIYASQSLDSCLSDDPRISVADSTVNNQPASSPGILPYSSIHNYSKRKKKPEWYKPPVRALSRSPPRSRKRSELSDLRRKSIERELESKQSQKTKKKKKKSKKRRRRRSESEDPRVKKLKKDHFDSNSKKFIEKKLRRDLKSLRKFGASERIRNKHKNTNKTNASVSMVQKNRDNHDNLEGIYTIKEAEKVCTEDPSNPSTKD